MQRPLYGVAAISKLLEKQRTTERRLARRVGLAQMTQPHSIMSLKTAELVPDLPILSPLLRNWP